MNNQTYSRLYALMGKVIDLKSDKVDLDEIVIERGEDADLLQAMLMREIEEWRHLEELDADMTKQELKEAEENLSYAIKHGHVSDDAVDWTDEQKIDYLRKCQAAD